MTEPDRIKELFDRGRRLATEGRLAEAETALREALRLTRGRGDAAESRACGNLGTFYGLQGRNFEAMLLYRRALTIDRARGDWRLVVLHLVNLATIHASLELPERLRPILREIDEALGNLGVGDPRYPETFDRTLFPRFESAIWLADRDGARRLLTRLRAANRDEEPRFRAMLDLLEARVLQLDGEHDAALAAIDRGLAVPGLSATVVLDLLVERLHTLELLGDADGVRAEAPRALEAVERAAADPHTVEHAVACGSRLAASLARAEGASPRTQRAYEAAAAATLERIRQLDACLRDLPELSATTAEDHAWFVELRDRFAADQEALLRRVANVLDAARLAGDSPLHDREDDEGLIRLCAWCCTVRTREGRWLPVAHFIPSEPNVRVTHSICPDCAARLRAGRATDPARTSDDA